MHRVKCPICEQYFDADVEPYIKQGRRYIHTRCANVDPSSLQEEQDKQALFNYIKNTFKDKADYAQITKLIKKYTKELNYSYSGILKALKYWYEIKGNSIDKSGGSIGIVEHVYKQAYDYYYSIWLANQSNIGKRIEYKEKVINISKPKRKNIKKNYFSFLDEEEINEQ